LFSCLLLLLVFLIIGIIGLKILGGKVVSLPSSTVQNSIIKKPLTNQNKSNSLPSTKSSTQSNLWSGSIQGINYKNITIEEKDRILREVEQSRLRNLSNQNLQWNPPASTYTPYQADTNKYMQDLLFNQNPPATKPACQKVFKVSKYMCIQTPECVCNLP